MKILLGAALILLVLYLISGSAITSVVTLGEKGVAEVGGKKLGYSMFRITFREQFLCYSYEADRWVMTPRDNGNDCTGPFIDSDSLCRALEDVGQQSVRLHWEGRMLECEPKTTTGESQP